MTIKEFARLCNCNPQTLRYYDHVDLLKPEKVDRDSGYRYYEAEQALDFVKIRNLQEAGFTIGEIIPLLGKENDEVVKAFDRKIREQERRLEKTRRIRQSYQTEMCQMNQSIQAARIYLTQAMQGFDPMEEFGIDESRYQQITEEVNRYFMRLAAESSEGSCNFSVSDDDKDAREESKCDFLNDPTYEIVLEKHGWQHVKEIFEEFAGLIDGGEFALYFKFAKSRSVNVAFATTILGMLLERNHGENVIYGCNVTDSEDEINHFWLLKPKRNS